MIREGLSFDDLLLVPQHSTVKSRSDVDTTIKWGDVKFSHPIIPANMKNICGAEMAYTIIDSGGLAILHRFMPFQEQYDIVDGILSVRDSNKNHLAVSIGIKEEDKNNLLQFAKLGVQIVCIDIAHGDSLQCVEMIYWIRQNLPAMFIIAGNVATGPGAKRLWDAGADVVKVGIGAGSICSTRIETGNGVPQMTAIMEVAEVQKSLRERYKRDQFHFISDGGLSTSGAIVKALCYADAVMCGNLFAGCIEAPGEILTIDGHSYKKYVGSSTHKTTHIEGVEAMVPLKGKFQDVLSKLLEGVRSGLAYQGVSNLKELKDNPEFIRITNAGLRESHPHDVRIIK